MWYKNADTKTDEAVAVKYVFSAQGEQYILVAGYTYQRLRTYSTRVTSWACSSHYKEGCKAKVHTSGDRVVYRKFGHHHQPLKNWTDEKPETRFRRLRLLKAGKQINSDIRLLFLPSQDIPPEEDQMALFHTPASWMQSSGLHEITTVIPEYVTSNRGTKLVYVAGYTYCLQKISMNQKSRWMCSTHHKKSCKAFVHIANGRIVHMMTIHNHPTNGKYMYKPFD
ncbi:hypothetical protein PYW08_016024 [Mythimna loreyi]|uniref:Uncharacterized protein n=1 Tax=Mythimna loreyi TaxID=667449 RepID=A0ACC2QSG9_9NEOP|nr:hypothetical protein PYW08_016024 [Mythimna loreyi]